MSEERIDVKVWDLPVRVVHWALVGLILFSWWSGKEGGMTMTYHMWSGYAILTLLVFRIAWGFLGSTHARFRDFLYAPKALVSYAKTLTGRRAALYAGHNPVGGLSALLMLLSMLVQAGTGLFSNDDILTEGPLYGYVTKATSDWLTTIHNYNFYVLLTLAGIHIAAILYYLAYKRENLVAAMFTGRKRLPRELRPAETGAESLGKALVLLAISAAIVWALVRKWT
jgi:cytochrome b